MTVYVSRDQNWPENYKEKDAAYVFRILGAGESCALVGAGSVGKSNLLRFITSDVAKRKHLVTDDPPYVMVLLNPHEMIYLEDHALALAGSCWTGYEIMLSRLRGVLWDMQGKGQLPAAESAGDEDLHTRLKRRYLNLFEAQNPLSVQAGMRHVQGAVYEVLGVLGPRWKLIFLFDEIEEFMNRLPPQFFQSLRGLRDELKGRLMFVTAGRYHLSELADELAATKADPRVRVRLGGFVELFQEFTHYISPLDFDTTRQVIEGYIARYELGMDLQAKDTLTRALFKITDGHAGLLRRCFLPAERIKGSLRVESDGFPDDNLLDFLLENAGVFKECKIIFESLPESEKKVLQQIINRQPFVDNAAFENLTNKYLVGTTTMEQHYVRAPVFRRYIFRQMPPGSYSPPGSHSPPGSFSPPGKRK